MSLDLNDGTVVGVASIDATVENTQSTMTIQSSTVSLHIAKYMLVKKTAPLML